MLKDPENDFMSENSSNKGHHDNAIHDDEVMIDKLEKGKEAEKVCRI